MQILDFNIHLFQASHSALSLFDLEDGGKAVLLGAIIGSLAYISKAAIGFVYSRFQIWKRKKELLIALDHEVADTIGETEGFDDPDKLAESRNNINLTNGYMPYTPTVPMDFGIIAVKSNAHLFSGELQKAILSYYYSDAYCTKYMDDFRLEEIRASDANRRVKLYNNYVNQIGDHLENSKVLQDRIKAELDRMTKTSKIYPWIFGIALIASALLNVALVFQLNTAG